MPLSALSHDVRKLSGTEFILVSDNCWGFQIYPLLNRPYNTPFVGLYIRPECYLKILADFDRLLTEPLTFSESSRYSDSPPTYPVGRLWDDIEIHFLHYQSPDDVLEKWNRRIARLSEDMAKGVKLTFKMCDNFGATPAHLTQFFNTRIVRKNINLGFHSTRLAHPRILHAIHKGIQLNGVRLFRKRYRYFDFSEWILSGEIKDPPVLPHVLSYLR